MLLRNEDYEFIERLSGDGSRELYLMEQNSPSMKDAQQFECYGESSERHDATFVNSKSGSFEV